MAIKLPDLRYIRRSVRAGEKLDQEAPRERRSLAE
jgi:hypothetical protein